MVRAQRDHNSQTCAAAALAPEGVVAAEAFDALLHAQAAESLGRQRIDATAIILHCEHDGDLGCRS